MTKVRVKITKGIPELIGATGIRGEKEGKAYRIYLDKPVYVKGLGYIKDDLWKSCGFKKIKE